MGHCLFSAKSSYALYEQHKTCFNSLRPCDAYLLYLTVLSLIHNGFLPVQYQVIIWANVDSLQVGPLGTNVGEDSLTTDWCEKWE